MHNYYSQTVLLAQIDKNDRIIGNVERWKAHKEGILHRGFTAILHYNKQILLQNRKHLAFDDTWDLTFSSHQAYYENDLESDESAIINALRREWGIGREHISSPIKKLGSIYYKAKDSNSEFTEHEIDYVFDLSIRTLPTVNKDFAYGYELVSEDELYSKNFHTKYLFAPWVKKILSEFF